ncbi:FHA domain-containing protein [Branchiibius hedensis]|uniref:FHA domain-containing protein n=1 Tax=Branchiibius hedensis TaxID=672460 RepID=A0A2Y8ZPB7_9MICO|nr:FHA domain-containing protein [Branchiibius hedensis]PWJ24399.1 FHA domain-containing protein [Branchiibius hedensis]SSA33216.1 FHA domain-containing protein [Branchiibius hedensis]
MNQSEARPATPISWGDAPQSAHQATWQGPPAKRPATPVGDPVSGPRHAAYVEPAPDAPSPEYAEPWVKDGTAHTADEVHQVWTEHRTSPEELSGEPAATPAPAATAPAATAPAAPAAPPAPEPASDDDSLTLGRARSNSIVLDDMLVSRHHARISADDQGLIIEDLGSRNGTFVNGRRVQTTRLHEGDRIGIGASTFEVRDGWLVSA